MPELSFKEEIKEEIDPTHKEIAFFEKHESIIMQLENQKKYILSFIQHLSNKNYGYYYSRINLLKQNLFGIQYEIEKNKMIIRKIKEAKQKEKQKSISHTNNISHKNPSYTIYKNHFIQKKPVQNENLVNELEQTLGNLSNLFI